MDLQADAFGMTASSLSPRGAVVHCKLPHEKRSVFITWNDLVKWRVGKDVG